MNATAILADREGRVVDGRFRLLRWLGGTAEGSVYLTETVGEGAGKAAIKLVPADSPGADARLAGWSAAARISHPHLLRVLHTGRSPLDGGEVVYAVTEVADEVLAEILPGRPLSPDETKEMLGPILDALACLHGRGLVHGRLKPSNILVVADSLKLSMDCAPLESAKAAAMPPDISASALSPYEAPEFSRGSITLAADVWSLGMTIAAALTQRTPAWDRDSGFEPVVRPALPAPFESIVRDCLRIDPASRLTLPEITGSLERNAPTQPVGAALHPDFDHDFNPSTARSSRGIGVWAGASIAAAVFLGIGITAFVLHNHQSPPPAISITEPAPAADSQPASPGQQPVQQRAHQPAAAAGKKPSAAQHAYSSAPRSGAASQPPAARATPNSAGNGSSANSAILKRVLPDVLPAARATIHGTVLIHVRVQVDSSGAVTNAVSESPAASRYFNRVAVQAAQAWRFSPAQAGGQASVWLLHFQFRVDGTQVTADQQAP